MTFTTCHKFFYTVCVTLTVYHACMQDSTENHWVESLWRNQTLIFWPPCHHPYWNNYIWMVAECSHPAPCVVACYTEYSVRKFWVIFSQLSSYLKIKWKSVLPYCVLEKLAGTLWMWPDGTMWTQSYTHGCAKSRKLYS